MLKDPDPCLIPVQILTWSWSPPKFLPVSKSAKNERGSETLPENPVPVFVYGISLTSKDKKNGSPSVTRLTQSSWTGMSASGRPSAAVRKMQTTSPMLEEIRYLGHEVGGSRKCTVCSYPLHSRAPNLFSHGLCKHSQESTSSTCSDRTPMVNTQTELSADCFVLWKKQLTQKMDTTTWAPIHVIGFLYIYICSQTDTVSV